MSMNVSVAFQTNQWKPREKEFTEALQALESFSPRDENCRVTVREPAEKDGPVLTIVRQRRIRIGGGWLPVSASGEGNSFVYQKGIAFPELSISEIVELVKEMLEAPVLEDYE